MDPQQQQQQESIFRAIALSSIASPSFTTADRQAAYQILDELKRYEGRIPLALQWLLASDSLLTYQGHDISTQTKLLALELISDFLQHGGYHQLTQDSDRVHLRNSILQAARNLAAQQQDQSLENNTQQYRGLSKKVAAILQGLAIRDFPQRWQTFVSDLFRPYSAGGLWYDDTPTTSSNTPPPILGGVSICLECLKLIAEDCTDSDYNANISTQRRNDVLIGLNEVSPEFLTPLFHLLEHYVPQLQQTKATLHSMHTFLLQQQRSLATMTVEERTHYQSQVQRRRVVGQVIADALVTLAHFCTSMPTAWILGSGGQDSGTTTTTNHTTPASPDFVAALLHLLREPECDIQVRAAECLQELALRGKLDYTQWMRLLVQVPSAIQEAQGVAASHYEQQATQRLVTEPQQQRGGLSRPATTNNNNTSDDESLASQLGFYRALSKMLSSILSSHIMHITHKKATLEGKGGDYASLTNLVRLLVELLQHPSGRIGSEQITLWSMLLRDPQIARSPLLPPYVNAILISYMNQLVKVQWNEVEDETHVQYKVLQASFDDEEDYDNWMADLRSRSSLLFKLLGHVAPAIAAETMKERFQTCLAQHGSGTAPPGHHQLMQLSPAVVHFEALSQPFESILAGTYQKH